MNRTEAMELAGKVADALYLHGATRLAMKAPSKLLGREVDQGGWCKEAAIGAIAAVLAKHAKGGR